MNKSPLSQQLKAYWQSQQNPKNVLSEPSQAVTSAIALLEASLIGTVLNTNGEPMSKDEIIDAVIDILRGTEHFIVDMTQEGGE